MKKVLAIVLALFLVLVFSGCTQKENGADYEKIPSSEIISNESANQENSGAEKSNSNNTESNESANQENLDAEKSNSNNTEPNEIEEPQSNNNGFISESKAKEIAFSKARVSKNKVKNIDIELDFDDDKNIWEYDVDFEVDFIEYECEIDAKTGKIIKFKADKD